MLGNTSAYCFSFWALIEDTRTDGRTDRQATEEAKRDLRRNNYKCFESQHAYSIYIYIQVYYILYSDPDRPFGKLSRTFFIEHVIILNVLRHREHLKDVRNMRNIFVFPSRISPCSPSPSAFYCSCIALSLAHLHRRRITSAHCSLRQASNCIRLCRELNVCAIYKNYDTDTPSLFGAIMYNAFSCGLFPNTRKHTHSHMSIHRCR